MRGRPARPARTSARQSVPFRRRFSHRLRPRFSGPAILYRLIPRPQPVASGVGPRMNGVTSCQVHFVPPPALPVRPCYGLVLIPGRLVPLPDHFVLSPGHFVLTPDHFVQPAGELVQLPDRFVRVPGRFVRAPDRFVLTPGQFVQPPDRSVRLAGQSVQLPGLFVLPAGLSARPCYGPVSEARAVTGQAG